MTETATRRVAQRHTGASFSWHRQKSSGSLNGSNVCRFWLAGNCSRNPCRFAHPDVGESVDSDLRMNRTSFKQSHVPPRQLKYNYKAEIAECNNLKRNQKRLPDNEVEVYDHAKSTGTSYSLAHLESTAPKKRVVRLNRTSFRKSHDSPRQVKDDLKVEKEECKNLKTSSKMEVGDCDQDDPSGAPDAASGDVKDIHPTIICTDWVNKSCIRGENCKFLHSWCYGDGFSMLAQLEGHKKAVTGITLPLGSDKLFSGSKDGTVRVWNCHTGECIGVVDVGASVECLISEGPWVLAGLNNAVKAWNIQTNADFTLSVQAGQVYAMVATNGMLLAGVHDGSILGWKFNYEANSFDDLARLKGHTSAVVSLIVGAKEGHKIYSGSMDKTIRVWDLETMQCIYTLAKHSDIVMSVLSWESFLLSCSLDRTLKVWASTEAGGSEVTYEHHEEHGILSLCGMHDAANKPILICSCNDNTVRLYELPSFTERGRIFSKQEVRAIHVGPRGLFFTGDGTGLVSVWRCSNNLMSTSNKAA